MARMRPTSVMVIAILQLVFGGLSLLQLICAGGVLATNGVPLIRGSTPQSRWTENLGTEMTKYMEQRLPYGKLVQYGELGLGVGLSVAMILSGIGLIKMQSWGRNLAIVYAFLSIGDKIFGLIYALLYTIPILKEFLATLVPPGREEAMALDIMRFTLIATPIFQLLLVIYPIVVLIFMLRATASAAFREPEGDGVLA